MTYLIQLECIILISCLCVSTAWHFESSCKMLHIMSATVVISYMLAGVKVGV